MIAKITTNLQFLRTLLARYLLVIYYNQIFPSRLLFCRVVRSPTHPKECPGYDTKQSDGEVPVMLKLSSPSLPGSL